MDVLSGVKGFEWDQWNGEKIEKKHAVTSIECEELFCNRPLVVARVPRLVRGEMRYTVLGSTNAKRLLFIAFTVRSEKIRVISARPMSRKERKDYEQETQA